MFRELIKVAENRDAAREMVRAHPEWKAFKAEKGIASRQLDNDLTVEFVERYGIEGECVAAIERAETRRNAARANAATDAEMETWIAGEVSHGMGSGLAKMKDSMVIVAPDADVMKAASAAAMADTVLDQLRPWLSPSLLGTVETALAPIVAAALKPAVEVETVVTVDASGKVIAPAFVPSKRQAPSTIAKLFGVNPRIKHADKQMSVWDCPTSPDIDPYFVADVSMLAKLVSAIDPALPRVPRNVWLAGPAGGGKSTLPEQVAARAHRPFVCITFQKAIEPSEVIGGMGFDGKTVWVDGVLTAAIRKPGTVVFIDEITYAPPGIAAMLQSLLASRKMTLPTGEVVTCADGVCFVVADNTRGYGDETGLYAGTHMANASLVDRMARLVVVSYLHPDLEAQALANHTKAPRAACDRVVAFVNSARKLSGFDSIPLSLRRQIAFVEMVFHDGFTVQEAIEDCVLSRLPDAERATISAHFTAAFDKGAFEAELKNAPVPVAPSSVPSQAAARGAFPTVD